MDHVIKLLETYRNRGLLLDTNLLLLFVVGECDIRAVQTFKRTKIFAIEDFYLLQKFVRHFAKIVTTPNVLTEVSSFLNQLPDAIKAQHFQQFSRAIQTFDEKHAERARLAVMPLFLRFGLTDS